MKIALGCDHGGFPLMQEVKKHLTEKGIEFEDFGTYSTDSCNYPEFGARAAHAVADGKCDFGIVICTTGIGISIAANKVRGARAALCDTTHLAEMTRRHNNANILAMGACSVDAALAAEITDVFLSTQTEAADGSRHEKRVAMFTDIENGTL